MHILFFQGLRRFVSPSNAIARHSHDTHLPYLPRVAITPTSMIRDRLEASRAQRSPQIELSAITPASPTNGLSDLSEFLAEDASIQQGIQQLRENVTQISALRIQSMNALAEVSHVEIEKIDSLTAQTRTLIQNLKGRIKRLESASLQQDAQLRKNRISLLKSKFLEAVQDYQREEQDSRVRSRQRVERQLKIVNPDATQEDIATAMEGGGQQIFAQALATTTRYGESRAAYREVQERQEDLRKLENTLAELAELFLDMAAAVDRQDQVIASVETTAQAVHGDTEAALENTHIAVKHARSYRKGRWICFFIFLFVICVLALVLGLVFGLRK